MNLFVVETEEAQKSKVQGVLDQYRRSRKPEDEVESGRNPNEVADIVSDVMINMIRRDLRVDEWPSLLRGYNLQILD